MDILPPEGCPEMKNASVNKREKMLAAQEF
jgi:hypothetical protein